MCVSSNVVMYEYDDDDDDGWGIFGREVKENGYTTRRAGLGAWPISDNLPIQRFYSFFTFFYPLLYSSLLHYVYFTLQMLFRFRSTSLAALFSFKTTLSFFFKKSLALNPMKVTINKAIKVFFF